jgi:hypothetical protein
MNIPGQFGFNCSSGFREEAFWNIFPIGSNVKLSPAVETKLPRNDHWMVLYKVSVFYADRKSKMATIAGHRLTLDPMGKAFEHFPIGSNVNLCIAVAAILDFRST